MVDLGSNINIIGRNTTKDFVAVSDAAGIPTSYVPRQNRLNVNGVAAGSATCDQEAIIRIAVQFQDSTPTKESFKANIAAGVGADLPAILGAASMRDKDAVLILRGGEEFIAFPGQGGYKIEKATSFSLCAFQSFGDALRPLLWTTYRHSSGTGIVFCDRSHHSTSPSLSYTGERQPSSPLFNRGNRCT